MKYLLAAIFIFAAGLSAGEEEEKSPLHHFLERQLKMEDLEDEDAVSHCPAAVYWVKSVVSIRGRFIDLMTDQEISEKKGEYLGNLVAVDSFGRLITNAHVISPANLIGLTASRIRPLSGVAGSVLDRASTDSIDITYVITSPYGHLFETTYAFTVQEVSLFSGLIPSFVRVNSMLPESHGATGLIEILAMAPRLDLAMVGIPFEGGEFLEREDSADLGTPAVALSFVWNTQEVSGLTANMEIRQGFLLGFSDMRSVDMYDLTILFLLDKYLMYSEAGNSGGALVNPKTGCLVGLLQSSNRLDISNAIPGKIVDEFYFAALSLLEAKEAIPVVSGQIKVN